MPIKGLTERARLPRLGKLHLGIKDKEHGFPRMVDYFVVKPDASTSEEAAEAFHAIYGDKPQSLDIMFPTEDTEQFASQWYRAYSQTRGLICRGDGERAVALLDIDAVEASGGELTVACWASRDTKRVTSREIPCAAEQCPMQLITPARCRRVMNLQFLLPKVPGLGVWQLDTSSINSILNTNSQLRLIKGLCGRVSLIPLRLEVATQEVTPQGAAKKHVPVLHIRADYKLANLARHAIAAERPLQALLPPPDTEPPEDLFVGEDTEQAVEPPLATEEPPPAPVEPPARPATVTEAPLPGSSQPKSATTATSAQKGQTIAVPDGFTERSHLFQAAFDRWKLFPQAVAKHLGFSNINDLSTNPKDLKAYWYQLVEIREPPARPAGDADSEPP